jgi:predicted GNAT family acetyltransferase
MSFGYLTYFSIPDTDVLNGILKLHQDIFGTADDLISKMANKPELLVITAMDGKKVVGYKIGYAIDNNKFYSWLGGVDSNYRKHGIASLLMEKQHQYLKENGYKVVQTKTMNKWRNMLILNIKNGFDIIDTYIDVKGLHKIILEKNLVHVDLLHQNEAKEPSPCFRKG